MKIVFFGTSNIALPILERLARHHEIAAVVTQPDAPVGRKQTMSESPVSILATELQVKTIKPAEIKNNNLFRLELTDMQADAFVVVSYGKIIPADILSIPKLGTLNVHPSLLPKYRGATPMRATLLQGDTVTGTTIMLMDEQMDHGPILAQQQVAIDPNDTYLSLEQKLSMASAELLIPTLAGFAQGTITPQEQDHAQATYTKILSKADGRIDWNKSATNIHNQFRAYYPWPGIWTTWNGKNIKILDCHPEPTPYEGATPGTVSQDGIVYCGNGTALAITSLQLEGKTETPIADFLRGYPAFSGSALI